MRSNPVVWFEIYVEDMDRAKKFYEEVFDTKLEKLETEIDMWNFPMDMNLKTEGSAGSLVKIPGLKSGGNSTIVYFESKDCQIELDRVEKAGGKIKNKKMSIGKFGFVCHAYDTEGNIIGIHSLK